jgi:adenine-specific DNA-methyltransferase
VATWCALEVPWGHLLYPPKKRLLVSFGDLDDMTDGLLIHSENFQALNLLSVLYREQIDGIYIDPPYNTDAGPILYKNDYKNSSWITMMADRIQWSRILLKTTGVLCATIDDYEQKELHFLLQREYGLENIAGTVTIRSNPSGRPVPSGFAQSHEYAIFATKTAGASIRNLPRTEAQAARYRHGDSQGAYMWELFRKRGSGSEHRDRPSLYYPVYVKGERVRVPEMEWDEDQRTWRVSEEPEAGEIVAYPIDEAGTERRWRGEPAGIERHPENYRAKIESDQVTIYYKFRPRSEGVLPLTVWSDAKYSATEHGTGFLKHYFSQYSVFSYPKSIYAVEDCLRVSGLSEEGGIACDFFAGSGTTGHAVINLNREDGGYRKFILVEIADYFNTVLLPRLKKVTFSPEWKDGKPKRLATQQEAERSPRIVKYIRLESYDDALNNIAFDEQAGQLALLFDDYLLKYMLAWETRDCETFLNVDKLASPFHYKLTIFENGEHREKPVDLPETFAYLLGLHVKTRHVCHDDGRRYLVYRGVVDNRETVVIWRETAGWQEQDYIRDRDFVVAQGLAEGADEILVNGDSLVPGARSLDPVFKSRMFGGL